MSKADYIWFDGELIPWKEAKIHVITNTLHYGTGVFEGIRSYKADDKSIIFRLKDHLKRFFYSAGFLGMKIKFSLAELEEAVKKVIKVNSLKDAYIRPLAFFNTDYMGLNLSKYHDKTSVIIAGWIWDAYLGRAVEEGASVKISKWRRICEVSLPVNAKISGYYVNSVIARLDAGDEYDEVILLDDRGYIAEGSGENIFLVKDSILYTPFTRDVLPGITRNTIINLAKNEFSIKIIERDILPNKLCEVDEIFFAGTAAEITPVVKVDGCVVGSGEPGPITRKFQRLYNDVIRGKKKKYSDWLTIV